MWLLLFTVLITAVLFTTSDCADLFDATTVYDVRHFEENKKYSPFDISRLKTTRNNNISGVVYKRTNALGLNLFLGSEKYESHEDYFDLLCDAESGCEWEFSDGWSEVASIQGKEQKVKSGVMYPVLNGFGLAFKRKPTRNDQDQEGVFIVFSSDNRTLREQEYFYILQMFKSNSPRTKLYYECSLRYHGNSKVDMPDYNGGEMLRARCYTYLGDGWLIDPATKFNLTYNGNMQMYLNGSTETLMDFSYNSYAMNFMSFYWNPYRSLEPILLTTKVWKSNKNESTIVSPPFSPTSKSLCLAVVIYCEHETKQNVLQVLAEDQNRIEIVLHNINNLKAGWQVKHINIAGYNKITSPWKFIFRKIVPLEVQISRISSCSLDGSEIEVLPPFVTNQKFVDVKNILPVYAAASEAIPESEKLKDDSNSCLNGGVLTSSGCACAPSFTGPQCQNGCGRNRFGQDCGGKCSLRSRECEGFLLCTEFTGCQCASGFTGDNCKTQCRPGQYGNDCKQSCGNCESGRSCDIYSGKCKGCDFGYLPPYCKQEYVYYARQPTLVSEKYETVTVSFNVQKGVKGFGEPKMYQIQYKGKNKLDEWRTYVSKLISTSDNAGEEHLIKETLEGLKNGVWYEVRVILMDAGFNKYDGEKVRPSQVLTKCDIPEEFDYKLLSSSNQTAITFTWAYELENKHWCPVDVFEVSWNENHRRMINITSEPIYRFSDFLPGSTIDFKVRAVTTGGYAPYSKSPSVSTKHFGNGPVNDLRMTSSKSTVLDIAWNPPLGSENLQIKYEISYRCMNQVACSPGCKDATEGQLTQEATSVTLSGLLPFTQYLVTVTPEDGPESQLYVGTSEVAPTEVPVLSSQNPGRSNTSVTVYWDPVPVCSSFLQGYTYQLTKESDNLKMLASGFTKDTSLSFYNLTASTNYIVKVFINTVAGWNPDAYLAINVSTSATVPEAVRNLTVYKKGRSMLGLRWAEPRTLYGKLKSFTVQYSLGKEVISETVEPTPCTVWPQLYCHTLENLKSNRKYIVMVSARNVDMAEDGAVASVIAVTKESAPLPPDSLKVLNSTSTSVGLQWKHPDLVNGVLRSFLVNVEESEKFDQDSCCQVYPLIEILVKEETQLYEVEVSGLHSSSTYYVSVSAKTVSMGLSQALVVYTRPPHLPLTSLPPWQAYAEDFPALEEKDVQWLPQQESFQVNQSDIFSPLITAHILLVAVNGSDLPEWPNDSGIKDKQLASLLRESISIPFFFQAEYKEDSIVTDSVYGKTPDVPKNVNQLIAVQISDYNDVYNIDLRYSSVLKRM